MKNGKSEAFAELVVEKIAECDAIIQTVVKSKRTYGDETTIVIIEGIRKQFEDDIKELASREFFPRPKKENNK